MKQTLFEAEAVLSVNTDKMFADLEKAVKDAKRRLESILGGITAPTIGGGRGGSGGGGGGGGSGRGPGGKGSYFSEQMALAQGEKAAGQYGAAIARLTNLMNNYKLSVVQAARAQNALEAAERKQMTVQSRTVLKGEKSREQAIKDAKRPGSRSSINPFSDEMAEIRLLRNTQQYEAALDRINKLLGLQLTSRQKIQALTLQQNVKDTASVWTKAGGVNPDLRRRNAQVQNLSFAIQDFATVISMGGGMSRALASASNNIAFMTSMMGTAGGAAAGLAVTLGAVFLPSLFKMMVGFKDASEGADKLKASIENLSDAIELFRSRQGNAFVAEDLFTDISKDPISGKQQAQRRLRDAAREVRTQEGVYATAREEAVGGRATAVQNFFDQMGVTKGPLSRDLTPEEQAWIDAVREGKVTSTDIRKEAENTSWIEEAYAGRGSKLKALADAIDEVNKASQEAAKGIQKATEELEAVKKVLDQAKGAEARGKLLFPPDLDLGVRSGRRQGPLQFGDETPAQRKENTEAVHEAVRKRASALGSLSEMLFPKEAEIAELKKKFADTGMGSDPAMQAVLDYAISQVKTPSKGEFSGQIGGVEFANQLTNMLSKSDPQTKLTEFASKQTGLQERIATATEATQKRLNEIDMSPFSSN